MNVDTDIQIRESRSDEMAACSSSADAARQIPQFARRPGMRHRRCNVPWAANALALCFLPQGERKGVSALGSKLSALPFAREVHLSPRVFCEQGFTKLGPAHLPSSGAVADGSGGGLRGEVGVGVKLRREGRESDYSNSPRPSFHSHVHYRSGEQPESVALLFLDLRHFQ